VREVDRLALSGDWDGLIVLRDACLDATEDTGRQLWGPARYAAYRVALEGPAALAAAMVEPGVVRFGLGPLTEVVAQQHTFAELAPHLDATVLPVVAQERVLRGEDLRGDDRALGASDDPPLVLQPFEPRYVLPVYRPTERLDGAVLDPADARRPGWGPLDLTVPAADTQSAAHPTPEGSAALVRALEEVVAPWAAQSGGDVHVRAVGGDTDAALRAVLGDVVGAHGVRADGDVVRGPVTTAELIALLAHAGASGGVHGRRRGGAAGRSHAWWVARCATGLARLDVLDADELEFLLEDVDRIAFRTPGEAAWRLELALAGPSGSAEREWAVAVAAFDRTEEDPADGAEGAGPSADAAPW